LFILGAVLNTAKVEKGSRVAVFGLGAVGLAVIMVRISRKKNILFSEKFRVQNKPVLHKLLLLI